MRVLFIGCGNMGRALIEGFVKSEVSSNAEIFVMDSDLVKRDLICSEFGLRPFAEYSDAVSMDAVVLAVKPAVIPVVARSLKPYLSAEQLVISIAAGVSIATLRNILKDVAICRVMPNLAALVAESSSSLSFDGTNQSHETIAKAIFSACGRCYVVDEKLIDAVVGVSGSAPAYVMLFIEALADGAVKMGMPRDLAFDMAIQTVKGSAVLLEKSKIHPAKVKDMVCSPGGTSIAAVQVLEEYGLRSALIKAVETAALRNMELAEQ